MAKITGYDTLVATLISYFTDGDREVPTLTEVEEKATELAPLLGYKGDVKSVVDEALPNIAVRMGIGNSLVGNDTDHDPEWVTKREFPSIYTDNYSKYLRETGWNSTVVGNLEIVTKNILGLLQDPAAEGNWSRRGLVIGHVQSGKTANYLGLVARAADAGYKFIIVVAGIHNNLRRQTQERVDEGFVGRPSDPKAKKEPIGVGLYKDHPRPVALTTILQDFKKDDASKMRSSLEDWKKPVVVVIKKNVSTLTQILTWLKDFNLSTGQKQIVEAPMLFIDDEADNASVNTNKSDVDPTKTNKLIREILALFTKNSYVGYTATPFANIFISPESYGDTETLEDLFPRDFIYCLDAPNSYFGADKIFIDDDSGKTYLREILDAADIIPLKQNKQTVVSELPRSLKKAVLTFILARAIRNCRGQSHKHCSMLVNVSRLVSFQKMIRVLMNDYVKIVREAIRANYSLPRELHLKNSYMAELQQTFFEEYSDLPEKWEMVLQHLDEAAQAVRLFVVNSSKSDEVLDYAGYDRKGEALTAIAIGGLSLSRGLTIEGLTVSYMYRNTKMYDTLLQMGRWFGYRPGYEDLCRVFLSPESIGWYQHIAVATEELRGRVKLMKQYNKTPKEFGLLVQSHPDALMVTALNKMRNAETRTIQVSYDGLLRETFVLSDDHVVHAENRSLLKEFYQTLNQSPYTSKRVTGNIEKSECATWRGIPADIIDQFLERFIWHPHHANHKNLVRSYLARIRQKFPEWDLAFITLKETRSDPFDLDGFSMSAQNRRAGRRSDNALMKSDQGSGYFVTGKQRVAGSGDERVGLRPDEMEIAKELAEKAGRKKGPTDIDFRNVSVRGRPLLMLHLIDLFENESSDGMPPLLKNAPALGVSFPETGEFVQIDYVLNKVMIDQMEAEAFDLPDDDEDEDD